MNLRRIYIEINRLTIEILKLVGPNLRGSLIHHALRWEASVLGGGVAEAFG